MYRQRHPREGVQKIKNLRAAPQIAARQLLDDEGMRQH